jgi:hypothetical protein
MARILPAPANQNFNLKGIPRESKLNAYDITRDEEVGNLKRRYMPNTLRRSRFLPPLAAKQPKPGQNIRHQRVWRFP